MKSFAATLLISAVVAQNSTNSTTEKVTTAVKDTANKVANFFSGLLSDYVGEPSDVEKFVAVVAGADSTGLSGDVEYRTTKVGANWVTMSLSLSSPAANFAAKTSALVYFQVEKPVFPAGARLLQTVANKTTNTTANVTVVASGTGDFESVAHVFSAPDATWTNASNLTNASAY